MSDELTIDRASGELVPVGSVAKGVAPGDLRESLFDDDAPVPNKKLYALELNFHGFKVFANPLKRRDYKRFVSEAKRDAESLAKMASAVCPPPPEGVEVSPELEAQRDAEFNEANEEAVETAMLQKTASETEIIRSAVVAWTLPGADGKARPYNEETLLKLRPPLRAELAGIIVAASVVSRSESDL